MDFKIVNYYYFSVDAVIRRAAETEMKLLQIPSSSTGRGPTWLCNFIFFSFLPLVTFLFHLSFHQMVEFSWCNTVLCKHTKWPSTPTWTKKKHTKTKLSMFWTRSLFSANLLKFGWCSIDGINFATLLCFTGNLSRVLFEFTGRQFEGVAYCTSWRFALRVAYFTKPLRPRRGVHSTNGYISMHFLLGITRFASGPFWNIK